VIGAQRFQGDEHDVGPIAGIRPASATDHQQPAEDRKGSLHVQPAEQRKGSLHVQPAEQRKGSPHG